MGTPWYQTMDPTAYEGHILAGELAYLVPLSPLNTLRRKFSMRCRPDACLACIKCANGINPCLDETAFTALKLEQR